MSKVAIQGNASGTGTFTIAAPNSNTDRTLTLPDEAGTVLTSASDITPNSGPAFSVYLSADQSISATTFTKVLLDTEVFDADNSFDLANSKFLPSVAGYYCFNGFISASNGANVSRQITSFYKNGSEYTRSADTTQSSSSYATRAGGSVLIYLNGSTDYVELYGWQSGSSTAFLGEDNRKTVLQGYLVRTA
jgi:hypothetical protein